MMPQQINVAATFNRTLAYEFGRIGSKAKQKPNPNPNPLTLTLTLTLTLALTL
jgi:hypothetical protein